MDDTYKIKLWQDYFSNKTPQLREQIILEYADLVKKVAGRLSMYLGGNVEYDDLVGYGVFGLIDAIDKYDLSKDVKFETYASLRIRGAILDQIRKMDWIPRTVRQRQKKIDAVVREIETRTGKTASDEDIAAALEISVDEYGEWQQQLSVTNVISINEFTEEGAELPVDRSAMTIETPEEAVLQDEVRKMLAESLEVLTEKEKQVVLFYYYEEMTLKEISLVLEVSESRISQLHTKALVKLKKKLGKYMGYLNVT